MSYRRRPWIRISQTSLLGSKRIHVWWLWLSNNNSSKFMPHSFNRCLMPNLDCSDAGGQMPAVTKCVGDRLDCSSTMSTRTTCSGMSTSNNENKWKKCSESISCHTIYGCSTRTVYQESHWPKKCPLQSKLTSNESEKREHLHALSISILMSNCTFALAWKVH